MNALLYVPESKRKAAEVLRASISEDLGSLAKQRFLRTWCAIAYLFPGLHPDAYEDAASGWPRVLKRFAAEAWRRAQAGELSEEELYPSDAAWCGVCDGQAALTSDESRRRRRLHRLFGNAVCA